MERFKKYFKGDGVIWGVVIALSLLSLLAVYSSTGTLAYKYQGGNTTYYVVKHMILMCTSIFIIFVMHNIHYKYYTKLSLLLVLIAIPLLIATLFMGSNINSANRWLTLPVIGLSFQTSDFAKLALILFVARKLSLSQKKIESFREAFMPIIVPVSIVCLLILPANFSTAALLFITCLILMFVGRVRVKYIFGLIGIGIAGAGLIFLMYKAAPEPVSKALPRIATWINRIENFNDPDSEGNYQAEQSKIAIANGGLIGKGPGNSMQRNFLPHPYSDFIYAIIIEEYGLLLGAIPIILLYLYLLYRAGVIVRRCKRTFPAFLVVGLTISIVFQAMINMAVTVNLFPVTGQPLPLVSMGGTSMLFTSMAFGIILSISRTVMEEEEVEKKKGENKKTEENEQEIEDNS